MAFKNIDEITSRYSMLHSLSVSDLKDNLEHNICHIQVMPAQIPGEMSKLQKEPAQQANWTNQAASLQEKDQQLAEIMEEEITHQEQVCFLSNAPPIGGGSEGP